MINFLKTYIEQLLYVAIFIVIIELILPKGNMKKYVYSVTSIVVLFLIISPIFNMASEVNIKQSIDNVIQTISKVSKQDGLSDEKIDFNNFKNSVITTEMKEKVEEDIRQKLLNIGLYVEHIEIDVTDKYEFNDISIYIKSLGEQEKSSIDKASQAISIIAGVYNLENSKIKIVESGGM